MLVGPGLYAIVGAPVGGRPGFAYSAAFRALNAEGATWTFEHLDAFLADPAVAVPGTRMGLGAIADERARAAVIAYLRTLAAEPVPLPGGPGNAVGPGLPAVSFTAAQADAGRDLYRLQDCVRCHGPALRGIVDVREEGVGQGDGPAIVGPAFASRWFDEPVARLFEALVRRKPMAAPGTPAPEAYANLLAFILAENGFLPREVALPAAADQLEGVGYGR